jgi:multicomponent Na+:H+ antiporter subunit E
MTPTKTSTKLGRELPLRKRSWRAIVVQAVVLFTFWLILSGHYDPFHLSLGVLSVFIVIALNYRINHVQFFSRDVPEWEKIQVGRVLLYIPWLLWQIVIASFQVAYLVLHPRKPVNPALLKFRAKLPNAGARVILGNSITLTPGTVTCRIEGDEFLVHALTSDSMEDLANGEMPTRVALLFQKVSPNVVSDVHVVRSQKEV